MADELNIPTHRWYQPRNNIALASSDFSKQYIFDSGIQKIDAFIGKQPWGNPVQGLFALAEPGVWYDPSDVANLDWRRNLLTYTEQFDNAAWTKTNATVTANAGTAPDGTTTAGLLTVDTATSSHSITTPLSAAGIGNHVASYYVKSNGANFVQIAFGASSKPNNAYVNFDLSTPSVGTSSFATGLISSVGNGWFRISCAVELDIASSQHSVAIIQSASNARLPSFTGDGTSGIYIWGAQLEVGSTATEYQRITDVNTEFRERFPTATLFQDTAGTIPVTTAGQPVALVLDKSKGLTLGPELVDGSFDDPANWSAASGWTVTGGQAVATSAASGVSLTPTSSAVVGKTYRITYEVISVASGGVGLTYGVGARTTPGVYTELVLATTTIAFRFRTFGTTTAVLDNVSVRELAGNHATQATAASRPTYGVVPQGGRRNLLTYTEQFDNAVWLKFAGSVTANEITAPDGTLTADRFAADGTTAQHYIKRVAVGTAGAHTFSFRVKADTATHVHILQEGVNEWAQFALADGTLAFSSGGTTAVSTDLGDGWWLIDVEFLTGETGFRIYPLNASVNNAGPSQTTTAAIYLWGAQLETGSTATAYQRVGTAFDVTEAGVASLSYLSFDGVDDFLVTPTITPGIDKAQVFAGVRKLSDAATAMLLETSTTTVTNNGSLAVLAPSSSGANSYGFFSKGTLQAEAGTGSFAAAPDTAVVSNIGDISGDSAVIRRNGSLVQQVTTDQGTGNYLAYPLYIGRRGGTSLPFNGQLYGLVVRFGPNMSADTITATENWLNTKTGAY